MKCDECHQEIPEGEEFDLPGKPPLCEECATKVNERILSDVGD